MTYFGDRDSRGKLIIPDVESNWQCGNCGASLGDREFCPCVMVYADEGELDLGLDDE